MTILKIRIIDSQINEDFLRRNYIKGIAPNSSRIVCLYTNFRDIHAVYEKLKNKPTLFMDFFYYPDGF